MKTLSKTSRFAAILVLVMVFARCGPSSQISAGVQYSNPPWAPPYYSGVRYYYLPDIEAYYDLSDRDFVYLDQGQWLFSPALPPIYSEYDLYNGFVVALSSNVYEPWMHHQYYLSHYPRYYYRNYYQSRDLTTLRGFNENDRKPIYWRQEDRNRIEEIKRNGRSAVRPNENVENRPVIQRPPQPPHYYGKNIGRPVRVQPQMRRARGRSNG